MQFITAADLHLRSDKPRCRIDEDWMKTQMNALRFLLQSARDKDCPLILNGDIFHRAVSSIELVNEVLSVFLEYKDIAIYSIAGNHDLPYHNLENMDRSAYGILNKAGIFKQDSNMFHFGTDDPVKTGGMELIVIHRLIMEKDPGFYMGSGWNTADQILDMYPDAKWILTGDNHASFVVERDGRYLLNPGSMLRQSAADIDQFKSIYFVDTEKKLIENLFVPDLKENVVSDYLTIEKDRDERIQAFVTQMKSGTGIGLSFEDNLEMYYQNAGKEGIEIPVNVRDLITEVSL